MDTRSQSVKFIGRDGFAVLGNVNGTLVADTQVIRGLGQILRPRVVEMNDIWDISSGHAKDDDHAVFTMDFRLAEECVSDHGVAWRVLASGVIQQFVEVEYVEFEREVGVSDTNSNVAQWDILALRERNDMIPKATNLNYGYSSWKSIMFTCNTVH